MREHERAQRGPILTGKIRTVDSVFVCVSQIALTPELTGHKEESRRLRGTV